MSADLKLYSPLSLLQEEEQARHVLLLSFNANLSFFERFALSAARSRGARVTVVGDVRHVGGDPAGVRNAGVTYLPGTAQCRSGGAFHSKLVLISGEQSLTAAIGSGNLTMNGWHGNAELWAVLRGSDEDCPSTFHALGAWLEGLGEQVAFSDGVAQALAEVSAECRRHQPTSAGPLLVSSLHQPILEQIPASESNVDELTIYAPFLDDQANAIERLTGRLSPSKTRVLIQSDKTVMNGEALASKAERHDWTIEEVADARYHHGKLIQWVDGGRVTALTGSANASIAALGRSMQSGGNCELGLIQAVSRDLAPEVGGRVDVAHLRLIKRERAETAVTLGFLGATVGFGRVTVVLSSRLPSGAWLELAHGGEAWGRVARLEPGAERYELEITLPLPAPLRVVTDDGVVSNVAFASDPERVKRRSIPVSGRRAETDPDDVFSDAAKARDFFHDIGKLREFLIEQRTGRSVAAVRAENPEEKVVARVKFRSWQDYVDGMEAHVGDDMLRFGLGLPDLSRLLPADGEEDDAQRDISVSTIGESPSLKRAPRHQKDRYRRWCCQLVELSLDLPPVARLIAWRLLLRAVVAGLWDDDSWFPLVVDMSMAVATPVADGFTEEDDAVASALAVSLAVLRSQLGDSHATDERKIRFNEATAAASPRLAEVSSELVEEYARELAPMFGASVHLDRILALTEVVRRRDPIEDAIDLLREEGRDIGREDRLLVVHELMGDPETDLLRIVGMAEEAGAVAATGLRADQRFLVAWSPPYVVSIRRKTNSVIGDIYKCGITTPGALTQARQRISEVLTKHASWFARQPAPELAREVLREVKVDEKRWLES